MSASTGPMLTAGGITFVNQVLLTDRDVDVFTTTAKIALATGVAASLLVLIERAAPDLAIALAWATVITTVFVRINGQETPVERILDLTK